MEFLAGKWRKRLEKRKGGISKIWFLSEILKSFGLILSSANSINFGPLYQPFLLSSQQEK